MFGIQCEVYDASGMRLEPTTCEEAFTMLCDGRAFLIEAHPELRFRTVSISYEVPVKVGLRHHVKMRRKDRVHAQLNKFNLFLRDGFTCQYCGRAEWQLNADRRRGPVEFLNRDHVVPRDRGGPSTWENLVTACSRCNSRKGNKSLEESGLALRTKPYAPLEKDLAPLRQRFRR